MKLRLPAKSVNEAVARSVISAFSAELNPTVEELDELKKEKKRISDEENQKRAEQLKQEEQERADAEAETSEDQASEDDTSDED